ncbi:MAG TPA: restriction endonuclease, partial [Ramlibacter sp.]|nr:restriction endonuclease [Ramlibacter sp.]
ATETPPISRFSPDDPAAGAAAHDLTPETAWSAKVFEQIEWRRFEAVCEQLFAQAGFEARTQSHGPDGGVDIWLHSKHADGPAAVVQCKHWAGTQIGVKQVREFFGVMVSHKLQRGTYATTSTFTADAAQFAKDNGISALDGDRLLALIATRTAQEQAQLLAVAYEGEYWKPTCASCGVKMVERQRKADGMWFWGCTEFPKCKTTMRIRQAPWPAALSTPAG